MLLSWRPVDVKSQGACLDLAYPLSVLVYTLAPDNDAEQCTKDGIHVERRSVVYGELWKEISPCCCYCWFQRSPGVEVQLVAVTSGPPQPPLWQCHMHRWDRLSACQLQGPRRLIVWSDLFWWNLWRAPLLSVTSESSSLTSVCSLIESLMPLTKQSPVGEGAREGY